MLNSNNIECWYRKFIRR